MIWSIEAPPRKFQTPQNTSVKYPGTKVLLGPSANQESRIMFRKWKWKSLSPVWLFVTPQTIQSMEFSRQEYWHEYPSPGNLPNPGIKPWSPSLQADSLPAEPPWKPKNTGVGSLSLLQQILLTQESNRGPLHCRWILLYVDPNPIHSTLLFPQCPHMCSPHLHLSSFPGNRFSYTIFLYSTRMC